jgi:hypothetical protein
MEALDAVYCDECGLDITNPRTHFCLGIVVDAKDNPNTEVRAAGADHQHEHNRLVRELPGRVFISEFDPPIYAYACECGDVIWTLNRR